MLPEGVVLDLDGTLVDNIRFHAAAFDHFMRRHGRQPVDEAGCIRLMGRRNSDIFTDLLGRPIAGDELKRFEEEKETLYRELSAGQLAPIAGLLELLADLDNESIPVVIATSAPECNVAHTLAEIGLEDRLTNVIRGDEVPRGKPHPDIFQEAARRVGVDPKRCLAFEDAPVGITAAVAAGMRCVALATTFTRQQLESGDPAPDLIVADFQDFLAAPGWATKGSL